MTIRRGEAWGEPLAVSDEVLAAHGDQELASIAAAASDRDEHPVIALLSDRNDRSQCLAGDVARTLGIGRERDAKDRLGYRFDLGFVELDGSRIVPFVAHLALRRSWWHGEAAVVMNCAWMGSWYLGPRAHPNDGVLDLTVGSLPPTQRLLARRRARTGSHLPHPALTTSRRASWEHRFDGPTRVYADGASMGLARSIRLWVEADCFTLLV